MLLPFYVSLVNIVEGSSVKQKKSELGAAHDWSAPGNSDRGEEEEEVEVTCPPLSRKQTKRTISDKVSLLRWLRQPWCSVQAKVCVEECP